VDSNGLNNIEKDEIKINIDKKHSKNDFKEIIKSELNEK
jgi:hypothetical protein